MTAPASSRHRWLLRAAAWAAVAVLRPTDSGPTPCPWRTLTGLDCPFCGATRAAASLAHGDVTAALDHNAFFVLLILAVYGWHRYYLVYIYMKHKHEQPVPKRSFDDLPVVTIQLPLYNEMYVVDRLIDAVCQIDYPREKLEIQVLDDSTDETRQITELAVRRHALQGVDHGALVGVSAGDGLGVLHRMYQPFNISGENHKVPKLNKYGEDVYKQVSS